MHRARPATALALSAALALAACGNDDEPEEATESTETAVTEDEPTETDVDEVADDEPEEESEEDESTDASAGAGNHPDWADPVATPGEQISEITLGDVQVDIYQVAVDQAPKDGVFINPDTNEPILAKGDDVVFLNYVVTNEGDSSIDMGSSLVYVTPLYDDWPWAQGMDGAADMDLYAKHEVHTSGVRAGGYREPTVYPLAPGESYSEGTNFLYQKDSPITFDATMTPVDQDGNLLHDDKITGTSTGTIS